LDRGRLRLFWCALVLFQIPPVTNVIRSQPVSPAWRVSADSDDRQPCRRYSASEYTKPDEQMIEARDDSRPYIEHAQPADSGECCQHNEHDHQRGILDNPPRWQRLLIWLIRNG
jgi:hypothetical protein